MVLVSVIVPMYNAEQFIRETLASILNQSHTQLEVVVVDDGSTDRSAAIVQSEGDNRIRYVRQNNSGVSVARNNGFSHAKGVYTVFFDADDVMGQDFLAARVAFLQANSTYGYCCGPIKTFPVESQLTKGAAEDVPRELLHYEPRTASCPSNYMFRTQMLQEHSIRFTEELSSTADRFFLLQIDRVAKGATIPTGTLHYRITEGSMSNRLSLKLIKDNEHFLKLLKQYNLVPPQLSSRFFYRINYILGLGFIRTGKPVRGLKYLGQAAMFNPGIFLKDILKSVA